MLQYFILTENSVYAESPYVFNCIDGTTVSTRNNETTILIFGKANDKDEKKLLTTFKSPKLSNLNNVDIIFVDNHQTSKEDVERFAYEISYSKIIFCYDIFDNADTILWEIADITGADSVTIPVAVFLDKNDNIKDFVSNAGNLTPENIIASVNKNAIPEEDKQDFSVSYDVKCCKTYARQVAQLINNFRTSEDAWYWNEENSEKIRFNYLPELIYDYELEQIAIQRAAEIALSYTHTRPNTSDWYTAYSVFTSACENIAVGHSSPQSVHNAFREDNDNFSGQEHRRNMLSDTCTAYAVGCVYYNGTYYWAEEFRNPLVDANETLEDNSEINVSVDVSKKLVKDINYTVSKNIYYLSAGSSEKLPDITGSLLLWNTYNYNNSGCDVSFITEWKSQDESIAIVNKNRIEAKREGITFLKTHIYDKDVEIPVVVYSTNDNYRVVLENNSYAYTGDKICPNIVSVTKNGKVISPSDYEVKYYNNIELGEAYVFINGESIHTAASYEIFCTHRETEVRGYISPNCILSGRSGDTYCKICNEKLADSVTIPYEINKHSFENGFCKFCRTKDTDFELPQITVNDFSRTVELNPDETAYMSFVPKADGKIIFYSTGDMDTYGGIFDDSRNMLVTKNDIDYYENKNFSVTLDVQRDKTYYLFYNNYDYYYGQFDIHFCFEHTHSFNTKRETKPTCTQEGMIYYVCSGCNEIKIEEETTPLGHSWNDGTVTKPATETCTGIRTHTCTRCGKTITETIPEHSHNYQKRIIQPSCTEKGYTEYECSICGYIYTENIIPALGHILNEKTTAASLTENGFVVVSCTRCSTLIRKKEIFKIDSVKLTSNSYTYNAKAKKPSVLVADCKGKSLICNKNYRIHYQGERKKVGKYSVKVVFYGEYTGEKTLYFTINPKGTTVSKISSPKSKQLKVNRKKQSRQTIGYQIQYSTSKNFKSPITKTVNGSNKTSKILTGLKKKTKYYVRIRTYKTVNGIKYYSGWSSNKSVKTK